MNWPGAFDPNLPIVRSGRNLATCGGRPALDRHGRRGYALEVSARAET